MVLNGLMNTFLVLFVKNSSQLSDLQQLLLLASFLFSAISLSFALRIFWPKTDDALSPIHHTGIRMHSTWEKYSDHVKSLSSTKVVEEICRESWVVAGIVKWRGIQIKLAAIFFVLSLINSLIWIILSTLKII